MAKILSLIEPPISISDFYSSIVKVARRREKSLAVAVTLICGVPMKQIRNVDLVSSEKKSFSTQSRADAINTLHVVAKINCGVNAAEDGPDFASFAVH
jgi:hypothetical protein